MRATRPTTLSLEPVPRVPGRIMSAAEVAAEKFGGHRTARWVREHAPGRLARTRDALFFERVIDNWLLALEQEQAS